jgi:dienelactone hydrolase
MAMTMATDPRTGRGYGTSESDQRATTASKLALAAVVTTGVGVTFIVAHDGSAPWRLVRVLVVVVLTAAVFVAVERASAAPRAAVEFASGLFVLPVGLAITLPYLTKTGLRPMTIAGLLTLLGGLVLLGCGAAGLVRLVRSWRRVLVGAGLLLAVFAVARTLGPAVAATNVPRTALGSTTPNDKGLSYRDVEFSTDDGVTLSGWWIPSHNGAAVVLLHGAGSTRSSVLDHAVLLARHGYGVLLFDARGHGRSGGRAMDFGWYGDLDTSAAVSFAAAQPDVDGERIAAVGMSMGGEEAIGASATDGRIRAVVAEGATNRVPGDEAWLSDEFGWRGAIQEGMEWLVYNTTDLLTAAGQPIALRDAVAAAAPRPVLLIAAGSVPDEERAGRYIESGSPDSVELWVVPDTGHTGALDTHPAEWDARVTAFLDDALDE